MAWLGVALRSAAVLDAVVTLTLLVYLDFRLHALKQSGDLPQSTPQLFGFRGHLAGFGQTIDLRLLYSCTYREIDAHTRRFVPIVRISLPLMPILILAVLFA